MNSKSSITATILKDHDAVKNAYEKYLSSKGNMVEREHWANYFRWELTRHTIAEELFLYPAFEKYLGDEGKYMADQDREDHQQVKNLLHVLEASSVADSHYPSTFEKLMSNLIEHIQSEEENDLPKFEKSITPDISASLVRQFELTKMLVPTQSHLNANHKVPFGTVGELMGAPIEKLRYFIEQYSQTN
ncbi:unnamed protein product [Rotaria sordida]|uniref:Hemerythrin-like domain-containing protein n=1 Tax=Rotaria sordida TaxID=392033 RepID=A0A818X0D6_9BILA|nr:unnamed protein product [Rotaria sordida]CAF1050610.1 unnamed protein product [Rotaria sordida]CAF1061564.1 unnamed protein product [Rotaria sordida]CAF1167485.1 unnamed protein product [Rotaria sordida]CAF3732076.1 unnamed protein product [Rotaria sordida]